MKVKVKKLHPNAVIPTYAKPGDAGLDLVAVKCVDFAEYTQYYTGLAMEIPQGYVGLLFPRSSISTKKYMQLANSVGVIDSSFRGEICMRFRESADNGYKAGDRIGQLIIMPYPEVELMEVDELSSSERGVGGFGSTGK